MTHLTPPPTRSVACAAASAMALPAIVLLIVLALLFLPGCSRDNVKPAPPQVVTVDKSVPYQCGEPPAVEGFTWSDVQWRVEQTATGKVFALGAKDFEALMANLAGALARGKQVSAQRDFYVACVERSRAPAAPEPAVTVRPVRPVPSATGPPAKPP